MSLFVCIIILKNRKLHRIFASITPQLVIEIKKQLYRHPFYCLSSQLNTMHSKKTEQLEVNTNLQFSDIYQAMKVNKQ